MWYDSYETYNQLLSRLNMLCYLSEAEKQSDSAAEFERVVDTFF